MLTESVEIVRLADSDKYAIYVDGKEKVRGLSFLDSVEWLRKQEDDSDTS